MLFFAGGVILFESLLSSKAHCDNKFRQRKMSSLCVMGAVWFGAPEGISEYVSTVINQRDTRAEMTLFIWFYSQKSFHAWKQCRFSWLCIGKYIFLAWWMSPFAECVMCFFLSTTPVHMCPVHGGEARRGENVWPPDPGSQVPRPCDGHAAHPEDHQHPDRQTWCLGKHSHKVKENLHLAHSRRLPVLFHYFSNAPLLFNTYWVSI